MSYKIVPNDNKIRIRFCSKSLNNQLLSIILLMPLCGLAVAERASYLYSDIHVALKQL